MELLIELVRNFQSTKVADERNRWASKILDRIYPQLSRFVFARVHKEKAEDVLQEIMRDLFKRLAFFGGQTCESFLSWVYTIAHCKVADSFRGRKISEATVADPKMLGEALAHLQDESAMSQSDRADLRVAIELLRAADYPCLSWLWDRFVIGLSFAEMAASEGIKPDSVRKRIERCLELAQKLVSG